MPAPGSQRIGRHAGLGQNRGGAVGVAGIPGHLVGESEDGQVHALHVRHSGVADNVVGPVLDSLPALGMRAAKVLIRASRVGVIHIRGWLELTTWEAASVWERNSKMGTTSFG